MVIMILLTCLLVYKVIIMGRNDVNNLQKNIIVPSDEMTASCEQQEFAVYLVTLLHKALYQFGLCSVGELCEAVVFLKKEYRKLCQRTKKYLRFSTVYLLCFVSFSIDGAVLRKIRFHCKVYDSLAAYKTYKRLWLPLLFIPLLLGMFYSTNIPLTILYIHMFGSAWILSLMISRYRKVL